MLFNSLEFILFLTVVLAVYFVTPRSYRWIPLLIASYCFYASWKAEHVLLLVTTTLIIYITGLRLGSTEEDSKRKKLLWFSVLTNLGILFLFKYFNLFADTFRAAIKFLNLPYEIPHSKLLLPIGISFYTFQALSYSIDVYRRKRPPEKHLGILAVYVSFFPQLLAGPIERSTRLLPQFHLKQPFDWDRFKNGFLTMLWGYFQKAVIADRLAIYVSQIYDHPADFHGMHLIISTLFFPMQLYCDFAGYSNIAIGVAQMMGFELMKNFNRPFVSRSIRDFVLRWHISLTRWILDYVYTPLAKKVTDPKQNYFLMPLVMMLIWLWHGASWNFVVIGILLGLFLIRFDLRRERKRKKDPSSVEYSGRWKRSYDAYRVLRFYLYFTFIAGVLFRSGSLSDALLIWENLFRGVHFSRADLALPNFSLYELLIAVVVLVVLHVVEWFDDRNQAFAKFAQRPIWLQYAIYYILIFSILMFGEFNRQPFIYFQF